MACFSFWLLMGVGFIASVMHLHRHCRRLTR
ncbi:DmsC/YnfH family molybdoenzyme membrane anchor subunit [Shigella flexneri]